MALRIYHLEEQAGRDDVDEPHRPKWPNGSIDATSSTPIFRGSLGELLDDIFAGRKLLKVYRQMKMYNDPTMNPYLYRKRRLVG